MLRLHMTRTHTTVAFTFNNLRGFAGKQSDWRLSLKAKRYC